MRKIKNKKVLVVAVHADDETLGCGGTLLKHIAAGDEVYWLIATHVHERDGWKKKVIDAHQGRIEKVRRRYGFAKKFNPDFPTTKLDRVPMGELIASFAAVVQEVRPEVVYLPNRSDVHSDHHCVFQAAYACTKSFRAPFIEKLLMFETLSETEFAPALPERVFIPNVFVDITKHFKEKLNIFNIYKPEVMTSPLPRSLDAIEALARYRGSRIGRRYAESFMLLYEAA